MTLARIQPLLNYVFIHEREEDGLFQHQSSSVLFGMVTKSKGLQRHEKHGMLTGPSLLCHGRTRFYLSPASVSVLLTEWRERWILQISSVNPNFSAKNNCNWLSALVGDNHLVKMTTFD